MYPGRDPNRSLQVLPVREEDAKTEKDDGPRHAHYEAEFRERRLRLVQALERRGIFQSDDFLREDEGGIV